METLKELNKETNDYLIANEGTSEFDMSINDISRKTVAAMKNESGTCFVGKINLYGEERKKEYKLVEYVNKPHIDLKENECNFLYNFEYSFCIPCYDAELEKMINERDKAEYTGTQEDSVRVTAIIDRIYAIGGKYLFWA